MPLSYQYITPNSSHTYALLIVDLVRSEPTKWAEQYNNGSSVLDLAYVNCNSRSQMFVILRTLNAMCSLSQYTIPRKIYELSNMYIKKPLYRNWNLSQYIYHGKHNFIMFNFKTLGLCTHLRLLLAFLFLPLLEVPTQNILGYKLILIKIIRIGNFTVHALFTIYFQNLHVK